jgi:hypothetical protein
MDVMGELRLGVMGELDCGEEQKRKRSLLSKTMAWSIFAHPCHDEGYI